jgi:hypothetical protein
MIARYTPHLYIPEGFEAGPPGILELLILDCIMEDLPIREAIILF